MRKQCRSGLARPRGDLRLSGGRFSGRRRDQAGYGMACTRTRAPLNWVSQGQPWGRCNARRRAFRVMRPARERKRRRRVLVVTICWPRPMRAVQRASDDLDGQPGGVGRETSRGEVVEPHAVLQVPDGVLDFGVAPVVGLESQGIPLPPGR